jgi:hypothetical protein
MVKISILMNKEYHQANSLRKIYMNFMTFKNILQI